MNSQNIPQNHILLIGAGAMSQAIAYDFRCFKPHRELVVIDRDSSALKQLSLKVRAEGIHTVRGDCSDLELMRQLFNGAKLGIGTAGYNYNTKLTELAIKSGSNWIDLGGNNTVVDQQFNLDNAAKQAGVAAIPDCGLAPGMVNIIGADMMNRLDKVEEMHFRVGGLPQNPKPPLDYKLCFSPEGLIKEYVEPARFIEDGEIKEAPSLTGWERVHINEPYGALEAFHTSGGASTMVDTFGGKVRTLDYKTLRYPGHWQRVKLLSDLGLFDPAGVELDNGETVSPRKLMERLFQRLGWVKEDVVILKAWAIGVSDGKQKQIEYRLIDKYDPETGLTAMARTTGFSAAVVARMILDGRITDKGILRQEVSVTQEEYLKELELRGVDINAADFLLYP